MRDDIGLLDIRTQQSASVGEGSAGEVGMEEGVLEEDGGREAHRDEAAVQSARPGERAADPHERSASASACVTAMWEEAAAGGGGGDGGGHGRSTIQTRRGLAAGGGRQSEL